MNVADAEKTSARLQPLKTCPMCSHSWMHASDLLADYRVVFDGVQRTGSGSAVFLFTHDVHRCGSTFAVPTRRLGSAAREILRRAARQAPAPAPPRSCLRAAIGTPRPSGAGIGDPPRWPRRSA